MSFLWAVLTCLRKYARFSGRASRAEYWNFVLFVILVSVLLNVLDTFLFAGQVRFQFDGLTIGTSAPLGLLFHIAVVLPLVAAGARRLHDTGRSAVYLFYPLIVVFGFSAFLGFLAGYGPQLPVDMWDLAGRVSTVVILGALLVLTVSPLIVVWWLTRPSQPGENRFGDPPVMRA